MVWERIPESTGVNPKMINPEGVYRRMKEAGHCPLRDCDYSRMARAYGIGTGDMIALIKRHQLDIRLEEETMGRKPATSAPTEPREKPACIEAEIKPNPKTAAPANQAKPDISMVGIPRDAWNDLLAKAALYDKERTFLIGIALGAGVLDIEDRLREVTDGK